MLIFDKIAPHWNTVLTRKSRSKKSPIPLSMDIASKCIVGEAWGFTDIYAFDDKTVCKECQGFACDFSYYADGETNAVVFRVTARKPFNETKKLFEEHWNEKHV